MISKFENENTLLAFLSHVQTDDSRFCLKRNGKPPEWSDAILHSQQYDHYPILYGLLGLLETVQPQQKVKILFQYI